MTAETIEHPNAGLKAEVRIDQLVDGYVKLRDKKAQIKARHDKELDPIDSAMAQLERVILAQLNRLGVDSFKTANGTAYRSERKSITAADGDAFLKWAIRENCLHLLEKRPSKTAVEEYIAYKKELPPGLNYKSEITVNIRRS